MNWFAKRRAQPDGRGGDGGADGVGEGGRAMPPDRCHAGSSCERRDSGAEAASEATVPAMAGFESGDGETCPPGARFPRAAGGTAQAAGAGRGAFDACGGAVGEGFRETQTPAPTRPRPDAGGHGDDGAQAAPAEPAPDPLAPDPRDTDPPEAPAPRASLSDHLRRVRLAAADLLYPPLCTWCRAEVMDPHALCPACWRETHYIAHPLCDRCGAPLSGSEDAPFCDHCLNRPLAFRRARAAVLYEGVGRDLTLAFKHGDRLDIARPASTWMRRIGRDLLDEADWVTPVPLHWTRLLKRRFNQSAELARRVARDAGRPYCGDLLRRTRATPSQGGLGRDERRANLEGAFAVRRPDRVRGARILLVDDVYTSGATLSVCAATLLAAGARQVEALCLARVAPEADGPIFSRIEEEDP